jgi:hypothetical protein
VITVPETKQAIVERLRVRLPDAYIERRLPRQGEAPPQTEWVLIFGTREFRRASRDRIGRETYDLQCLVEVHRDDIDAEASEQRAWDLLEEIKDELETALDAGALGPADEIELADADEELLTTSTGWVARIAFHLAVKAVA